jgi:hypothetical protein
VLFQLHHHSHTSSAADQSDYREAAVEFEFQDDRSQIHSRATTAVQWKRAVCVGLRMVPDALHL